MAGITFKIETSGLDKMIKFLDSKTLDRAMRAGIRQASSTAKTQAAKGIGERYTLPAARIKEDINVRIPPGAEYAALRFSRRPPTLTQYGARPGTRSTGAPGLGRGRGWGKPTRPGKPVTAAIFRGQREPERGAFMATGRGGNKLVFRRDSEGKLHSVYGPSIGSIFLRRGAYSQQLQSDVQAKINEAFIKGFQKTLDSAARGYGGR